MSTDYALGAVVSVLAYPLAMTGVAHVLLNLALDRQFGKSPIRGMPGP